MACVSNHDGACYNGRSVMRSSDLQRLLAAGFVLVLTGGACLDMSPPASDGTLIIPTVTATLIPTSTSTPEPEPTATSTVTPTPTATFTATPSPTSTPPGGVTPPGSTLITDPVTGQTRVVPSGSTAPPTSPQAVGTALAPGLVPSTSAGPGTLVSAGPSTEWGCDGDERMEFVPPAPRAAEKMFIFVTGARDRAFGLIIGQGLSGVQGASVAGGSGLKKQWELVLPRQGSFQYHFYGGPYPEHLCVSGTIEVAEAASTAPVVTATATGTPTRTPTPLPPPRPDH